MRNELSFKELAKVFFDASKNIPFLIKRHIIWDDKHQQSNKYTYLGFDHTGSVPLHIYGKDIIKTRWIFSSWFPHHNPKAYKALERIIKTTQKRNLKFYLVHQPYRYSLVKKHAKLQEELSWFDKRVKKIMNKNNATFLNLNTHLSIKDKYFADRSHLNEKGSVLIAKEVGKFIDRIEK
jgi:hypothetical protein